MEASSGNYIRTFFSILIAFFLPMQLFSSTHSLPVYLQQDTHASDTISHENTSHEGNTNTEGDHHENLKLGSRLFFGLTGSSDSPVNCASCHNTKALDTLNWNPSAVEIAFSAAGLDSAAYANMLLFPVGKRLSEAHAGIELTAQEILLIRQYLAELGPKGLVAQKPDIRRMMLFLFLVILFLLATTDMIFFKSLKYKVVSVIVIMLSFGWGTKMVVQEAIALGRSKNYAPVQPIKFSHVIHAGENQIDCQYCHHTAEQSKSAGIPSMNVCLNCHTLVRDATRSGKFEINKIHAAVDSEKPVEWIRVHRLPDFVFFSHAQHVGAGKLDCAECHGPVKEMHVLEQYTDLSMGWCLDCHRSRKVDFLENEYYSMNFTELHRQISIGEIDSVLVEQIGGTDCMTCHY
ncbi:MAG TPA: hypothetical protein ENI20_14305 [Bacteroides sp.]|nr:hypothetical protein [Bacteroides sp.]